jgi:hypothetical protein
MVTSNQRKKVRIEPEEEQPIRVDLNGENFLDILYAKDISEQGIGIQVNHDFEGCEINQPVSMIVSLPYPYKCSFTVKAQIKYVSGHNFGAIFHELTRKDKKNIQQYIAHQLRDESWFTQLKHKLKMLYS